MWALHYRAVKLEDGRLGGLPEVSGGEESGSVRPEGAWGCLVEVRGW